MSGGRARWPTEWRQMEERQRAHFGPHRLGPSWAPSSVLSGKSMLVAEQADSLEKPD